MAQEKLKKKKNKKFKIKKIWNNNCKKKFFERKKGEKLKKKYPKN